jgi:hypothetical protein
MAVHTFTNAHVAAGTSNTDVYTCPASTQATVHSLSLSNMTTSTIKVSVFVYDTSATALATIVKDAQVEMGNSLVWNKPLNLETTDVLRVVCDTASACEAVASILEIS